MSAGRPGPDEGRFTPGGELEFEHVGTFVSDGRLLLCDVDYFPSRFAGARQAQVGLDAEIEVEPGVWQVLVAYEPGHGGPAEARTLRFVLLTHDRELDTPAPLDRAEAVALLRVDSGRITAIDPELRDDDTIQTAVIEAPREQVPCMLRPLDEHGQPDRHADPRGALLDIDAGGVLELYAAPGQPRRALFLAV
ncbi:hypothetical protein ENSA5_66450 [Enhygromyxa salina]|uniref:Uncharacterized protein n=1 Tax=Enhygromyxa salina TaxID=215803 RepID=A0A2S9XBK2_9BACT|nr:hypothetical protein [Enhygromyxa salina]PRP90233.1 hypothetical protein ENSA5_66450 [Enhygromyxa salina]